MTNRLYPLLCACLLALVAGAMIAAAGKAGTPAKSGLSASPLVPVDNGFLYQGRLTDSDVPANGSYDFLFKLHRGGTQVGSTITLTNQLVDNGLFTVAVDFPAGLYVGDNLELALEMDARVSGSGAFTFVSSRPLPAVPYANGTRWFGVGSRPAPYNPLRLDNLTTTVITDGLPFNSLGVTVGSDGLPVVAYCDPTGSDAVKLAHCNDPECTSFTSAPVYPVASCPRDVALTIGQDDFPILAGTDGTNLGLTVAHCTNVPCTSATVTLLDNTVATAIGLSPSIAIGDDGFAVISYGTVSPYDLRVAHCSTVSCTSATITTLDSFAATGFKATTTSIAIGADANAMVAYHDIATGDLMFAHCNTTCSLFNIQTVDNSPSDNGPSLSITTGADGLALIAYDTVVSGAGDLRVAHCNNAFCTSPITTTLETAGNVGTDVSVTTGPDGYALISYLDRTNGALKLATCNDPHCTSISSTVVDAGTVGSNTSLSWGIDGLPLIAYHINQANKLVHCGSPTCISNSHAR